ncbi:MAG: DUF4162 domain-containing protein, partial [Alphaproteobacteria bacterium]|nr:DUF4162 domain-containing protein [Alphaproteobacteria bacterium]
VIFSTHVMQHAERLCDRLLLLRKGHKRFEGTIDEARATLPARITAVAPQSIARVAGVHHAEPVEDLGAGWHEWTITLAPDTEVGEVLERCTSTGVPLRRFEEHRANLHDVFVSLVGAAEVQP